MEHSQAEQIAAGELYRLAAFTTQPDGGNPAGVWVGEALPPPAEMQSIAAKVGYSETAFVAPASGLKRTIRYYSPEKEVAFCGHATIATGVLLGEKEGDGHYQLSSLAGSIAVAVETQNGLCRAALTSVEPRVKAASPTLVREALACLGWASTELDPVIPVMLAYAGVWHLVVAAATAQRLAALDYHFEALKKLMLEEDITTLQLIWREKADLFHARNPFPVGGVVEDPATGAAAAALGGYLRSAGLITPPADFTILQGAAMGRPSRLFVHVPAEGGIIVAGNAIHL
jgi:PhzF family phenazine biosynthesis protein